MKRGFEVKSKTFSPVSREFSFIFKKQTSKNEVDTIFKLSFSQNIV